MDYSRFVRLRRPLWRSFARHLEAAGRRAGGQGYADLEDLAFEYRQVLHDHALAGDRFAGTGASRRLAALALAGTRQLTRRASREGGGLWRFLTRTYPAAFQRQAGLIGVAVALFLLAGVFGLVLSTLRPELGSVFLGPDAVHGLSEGKLWTRSLTSTVPPAVSSSRIATNNIGVALLGWTGGLLAGLVPLYVILLNGFLLGSVLAVTMHFSMGGELLAFTAAHGPLEITLILVTAGTGLGLGRALVAAGDLPRAAALRAAGQDALAVLLGALPWLVALAVIEATVSPSPGIPLAAKIVLGCGMEGLFLAFSLQAAGRRAGDG